MIAVVADPEFVGCYGDKKKRAMVGKDTGKKDMTIKKCKKFCKVSASKRFQLPNTAPYLSPSYLVSSVSVALPPVQWKFTNSLQKIFNAPIHHQFIYS